MGKIFLRSISFRFFLIFIISLFLLPVILGNGVYLNLFMIIISSHYVSLILNNIYIMLMYRRIGIIDLIYDKIITRLGKRKFVISYLFYAFTNILIYILISNLYIYVFYGLPNKYLVLYIYLTIMNVSMFSIIELIGLCSFQSKKNIIFIILSFMINMVFHYLICPIFLSSIV